jgi:signal transduction histidine kinase
MRLPWASFVPAWLAGWYFQGLFHYYAVFVVSLMSLIAALFSAAALGRHNNARTRFVTLAFSALAALSLVSSLSLPDVIIPGDSNPIFILSWRLNTFASALFFAAAGIRWSPDRERWIRRHRRACLLISISLLVIYVLATALAPASASQIFERYPLLEIALASATITLLLWAAWRSWRQFLLTERIMERRLAVTMALLAQAHLFRLATSDDGVGWWFYQLLILMALTVALRAIVAEFEAMRELRPARYFFAVGSVLILGLSLAGGELASRSIGVSHGHWIPIGLALVQGGVAFLVLYIIVLRLEHLIAERSRELEDSRRRGEELTRLIIHDLRNPLTVIGASIELLDQGHLGPTTADQKNALKLLMRSKKNVHRMIEDMIDLDRLESGALKLQKAAVDLARLFCELETEMQPVFENGGQVFSLDTQQLDAHFMADRSLLYRAILNLVDNAAKFSPPGGRITLSASADESAFALELVDQGPSVRPTNRERIFARLEQTRKLERRGKGLSLAFCHVVVEAHGGTLRAEDNPDGGLRFRMDLPAQKA